jgi:DNA-binding transcriptional LysR family regulator
VKYSVNTVESARSLVRAGLGITVQPGCMLSVEDQAQLATVPLAGDWAKLSHCIGTLRGRSLTAASKAMIEQLMQHASALHDTHTAENAVPRGFDNHIAGLPPSQ